MAERIYKLQGSATGTYSHDTQGGSDTVTVHNENLTIPTGEHWYVEDIITISRQDGFIDGTGNDSVNIDTSGSIDLESDDGSITDAIVYTPYSASATVSHSSQDQGYRNFHNEANTETGVATYYNPENHERFDVTCTISFYTTEFTGNEDITIDWEAEVVCFVRARRVD